MNLPVNPATWPSFDLSPKNKDIDRQIDLFLNQLSQFCVAVQNTVTTMQNQVATLQTASGLAAILNGAGLLTASALQGRGTLINVTTNQTFACLGFTGVVLDIGLSSGTASTWTLALTNLAIGVPLACRIANNTSGAITVKITCTDTSNNALTVAAFTASLGYVMSTTGRSTPNNTNTMYVGGVTSLGGNLDLIAI